MQSPGSLFRFAFRCLRLLGICSLWLVACGGDVESRLAEVRELQEAGQFAESIEVVRGVLDRVPGAPEANYLLGLALVRTGEPMRAAWPLQMAVADPEYSVPAGLLLATLYQQTQNFDESVRAADRVLEVDASHLDALRVRANAHLAARRLDAALADAERLVDLAPEDYHALALLASILSDLERIDEARLAHDRLKEVGSRSDDARVVQRSCIAPAIFATDSLHDAELARTLFDECADTAPTDPFVLETLARFHDQNSEPEVATRIIQTAAAAMPDDLALQLLHFRRVFDHGEQGKALALLVETSKHFDSVASWSALASVYRSMRRNEDALAAIEKTLALSPVSNPQLLFTQADILIDVGELDQARSIAEGLDHDTYAHLIRGRILLISGDPAAALDEFDQGILAWPNNPGARFLAGLAARDLGDHERAMSELREAVRSGRGETDAALEIARIHYQRGEFQQALAFANTALAGSASRPSPGPYVVGTRARVALGQHDRALRTIAALLKAGFAVEAARERALLERQRGDPAAAIEHIEASQLDTADPTHFEVLGQLVEALSELGRANEAVSRADAALAHAPNDARLHQIRGVALLRAGRSDEARGAFEHTIEIEGDAPIALAGLATLRHAVGDLDGAISLFDRADALDPGDGSHAYASAQLELQRGAAVEAERRLRALASRNPGHIGAANDLAWMLALEGRDLDLALELVEAARQRSDAPEVLDTAGFVRLRRAEFREAVDLLERAIARRPDAPSIHYRHALALEGAGETARARTALETALAMAPFPEADAARKALERIAAPPSS